MLENAGAEIFKCSFCAAFGKVAEVYQHCDHRLDAGETFESEEPCDSWDVVITRKISCLYFPYHYIELADIAGFVDLVAHLVGGALVDDLHCVDDEIQVSGIVVGGAKR